MKILQKSPLVVCAIEQASRMKKIFLASLFFLVLVSCSNPIPESKMDYVGVWQGRGMGLLILPDGTVSYERLKEGGKVSVNGPLKEFVGDDFVVGVLFITTTFEVSEPPHEVNGQWQMVVDGVRLNRVD